jgi:hypothetical protein
VTRATDNSVRANAVGRTITEPTSAEITWIDENVALARKMVGQAGRSMEPQDRVGPDDLDAVWSQWIERWRPGEDANPVINALGLALGNYLVDRADLSWKVVEDEYGTEIALHGQPGDILIFPTNLVAKRFESRTKEFFVAIVAELETRVATLRSRRQ